MNPHQFMFHFSNLLTAKIFLKDIFRRLHLKKENSFSVQFVKMNKKADSSRSAMPKMCRKAVQAAALNG
jgi:hypothetical protein